MLKTGSTLFLFLATIATAFAAGEQQAAPARSAALKPASSHAAGPLSAAEQTALVKQYCATCHNDRTKAGQMSLQAFDAAGGAAFVGAKVPVENTGGSGTRDSHWRESVFDAELMTGYMNAGVANPLSAVTAASLRDLGYSVDVARADSYALSSAALPAPGPESPRIELVEQAEQRSGLDVAQVQAERSGSIEECGE